MLLFKVGLLTLIKIDSFMFLAKLCLSLPIIWKLLWLVGWPVWLLWWWIGEGTFRCSLYLSPKVLEVSHVFIITTQITTLVPIHGITLVDNRVFVLGGDQEVLDGTATFEVGLNAISTTDLLDGFTKTLYVGYDNVTLSFDFIGGILGSCGAMVISPINILTGRHVESSPPCPKPIWDICIWWEPSWGVPFPVGATQACCTLLWPYGRGCGWH